MATDSRALLPVIVELHDRIRSSVVAACEAQSADAMSAVAHDDAGDTIYAVDKVSETTLIEGLAEFARSEPVVLIAEGLPP
ncbi:MAG: inositol monophosphatase, partial [Gemmatimonadaceae bacterium]